MYSFESYRTYKTVIIRPTGLLLIIIVIAPARPMSHLVLLVLINPILVAPCSLTTEVHLQALLGLQVSVDKESS